jgi:alpha-L-fucosidase 2
MLLQSHTLDNEGRRVLHLLPALPPSWPAGQVRGLCARGGFTVDICWADGRVIEYSVRSQQPQPLTVRVNGRSETVWSKGTV